MYYPHIVFNNTIMTLHLKSASRHINIYFNTIYALKISDNYEILY